VAAMPVNRKLFGCFYGVPSGAVMTNPQPVTFSVSNSQAAAVMQLDYARFEVS